MTDAELKAIRERWEAMTDGDWANMAQSDAHDDIAALLAEVERLREEVERYKPRLSDIEKRPDMPWVQDLITIDGLRTELAEAREQLRWCELNMVLDTDLAEAREVLAVVGFYAKQDSETGESTSPNAMKMDGCWVSTHPAVRKAKEANDE